MTTVTNSQMATEFEALNLRTAHTMSQRKRMDEISRILSNGGLIPLARALSEAHAPRDAYRGGLRHGQRGKSRRICVGKV